MEQDLPHGMPEILRDFAGSLKRHTSESKVTEGLIYAHRDTDGSLVRGQPVQIRPWDWIEHLGDASSVEGQKAGDEAGSSKLEVKNNTSLPLEWFEAKPLGERIRHWASDSPEARFEHIFEDDFVSESVYERDWREARVGLPKLRHSPSANERFGVGSSSRRGSTPDSQRRRSSRSGSRRGSPALSVRTSVASRSSANPPSATPSTRRTQSPAIEKGVSAVDVIDVDALANKAFGKRKASAAQVDDDDDVIIIESTNDSKKGKGRAGKTVSSKTTRVRGKRK